jgi:hypothetical protein
MLQENKSSEHCTKMGKLFLSHPLGLKMGKHAAQPRVLPFSPSGLVRRRHARDFSIGEAKQPETEKYRMKEQSRCASFLFHIGLSAVFSESAVVGVTRLLQVARDNRVGPLFWAGVDGPIFPIRRIRQIPDYLKA